MPTQSSKVIPISEAPTRAFAREAVAVSEAVSEIDAVTGVLLERIADYLGLQLRALHGKPTAHLHEVPPGEANQMRVYAHGVLRIVDEIRGDRPPSALELALYDQRKQNRLARSRVRCIADNNGHRLGVWRPDPDRPGRELASCDRCGAGATLDLQTAFDSVSAVLQQFCRRRPTADCHRFTATGDVS